MARKFALVIGNTEYGDPGLVQLAAPQNDTDDFARVLRDPNICAFDDVRVLFNELSSTVIEAIDAFFDERKPDDLLVLYFSGHGVRDELGSLYLAFKNTIRTRLRATAIKSDYIREAMDQSRSKRQVVILDCCNSGAFPQGTKAEIGGPMGMAPALQGYGRFVLTASDATQFAWEGDKLIGEARDSLFTHFLVKGLEGEADSNGDGKITVDDLYDYAYEQISKVTAKQTPTKSAAKVEGEFVMRRITRLEDIPPVALPAELLEEADAPRPYVRQAAVERLDKILQGRNIGLARSALAALQQVIADENTTRHVAALAQQAVEGFERRQATLAADTLPLPQEHKPAPGAEPPVAATRAPAPPSELREQPVQPQAAALDVKPPVPVGPAPAAPEPIYLPPVPIPPVVAAPVAQAAPAPKKRSSVWLWVGGIIVVAAAGFFGLPFARRFLAAPPPPPTATQPAATMAPIPPPVIPTAIPVDVTEAPVNTATNPAVLPTRTMAPSPTTAPTRTAIPSPTAMRQAILHLNYNSFCRVDPDNAARDITAFDAGQEFVIEGEYYGWYLVTIDVPLSLSRAKRCWIFLNLNTVSGDTSTIQQIDSPWGFPLYP